MTVPANDRRIDYIEFAATDIERVKRFYAEVFGWKFTDYGPGYTSFEDGRLSGGFQKADTVEPGGPGAGGPLVVIYAAELEAMQKKVTAAGGVIIQPIFSFPGGRRFHFEDPVGNTLAVWSDR